MGFKTPKLGPFAEIVISTSVAYIADGTGHAIAELHTDSMGAALGVFCGDAFPKPDRKHCAYTMFASWCKLSAAIASVMSWKVPKP